MPNGRGGLLSALTVICAVRDASHRLKEDWLSPDGCPARMFSTLISSSRSHQWSSVPLLSRLPAPGSRFPRLCHLKMALMSAVDDFGPP